MHEYGTTSEQLAWIKVAAAAHAQHNPNAMLREPVTVEEVLASPMISDPLHKLDCCVVSDGGGALVVVRPEIAARLKRPVVNILGAGDAFAAGFLCGRVRGLDWRQSGRLGAACGAIVVTKHGCANFMPTWDEVMAFVGERGGL